MIETELALAMSARNWADELHRFLADHGGARVRVTAMGPEGTPFEIAASRYGLPRQVLSDYGLIFTGRLHGTEIAFEVSLKELGVELIKSAPYHSQTGSTLCAQGSLDAETPSVLGLDT